MLHVRLYLSRSRVTEKQFLASVSWFPPESVGRAAGRLEATEDAFCGDIAVLRFVPRMCEYAATFRSDHACNVGVLGVSRSVCLANSRRSANRLCDNTLIRRFRRGATWRSSGFMFISMLNLSPSTRLSFSIHILTLLFHRLLPSWGPLPSPRRALPPRRTDRV